MPAWAVAGYLAGAFEILLPLVVAAIASLKLRVTWRYFGYGALIFFIFQIATRVPITQLLQVAVAPQLTSSPTALWLWLAFLALTAGLFEELGRYVGYRVLMRNDPKTWDRAVMYGLGHGGLESILLIGVGTVLAVNGLSNLAANGLQSLPDAQQTVAAQQLAAVSSQPIWVWLLGGWERVCALAIQVALSVVVLQVFLRGTLMWLGFALLAHIAVDGVTVRCRSFSLTTAPRAQW
jgi:uncharacterized membrane protein YhfC